MASSRPWQLTDFEPRLDEWIDLEDPSDELRIHVTAWILTRIEDPFDAARREAGFPNLWSAVVPGSIHPPLQVVHCSFWIDHGLRQVRCNLIASLSYPA